MFDRRQAKIEARQLIRPENSSALKAGAVMALLLFAVFMLTGRLSVIVAEWLGEVYDRLMAVVESGAVSFAESRAIGAVPAQVKRSMIVSLLVSFLRSALLFGGAWYCLRLVKRGSCPVSDIFDSFGHILKIIGIFICTQLATVLTMLLFIIPGIMTMYAYKMVYFILKEHPEYGVFRCMRESRYMMYGHKMELFIFDLSFLPWFFIANIPAGILRSLTNFDSLSVMSDLCSVVTYVIYIWLLPYYGTTLAMYYDNLRFPAPTEDFEEPQ